MQIDHVRFCVEDAKTVSRWFIQRLGFCGVASGQWKGSWVEVVRAGSIYFVLSSPLQPDSATALFLQQHPPGVADVVFQVSNLKQAIARATAQGALLLQPIQQETQPQGQLAWSAIAAWGGVTHTLVERQGITTLLPLAESDLGWAQGTGSRVVPSAEKVLSPSRWADFGSAICPIVGIDHVVLNVAKGDLSLAVAWYERVFGFQPQQVFEIQTQRSALSSQVMRHPSGCIQLPINEPASANSQIQEFLEVNRGPGIQHIALTTVDLLSAIAQFREAGLPLIQIPSTYYAQLRDRPALPFSDATLARLEQQQLLADWQETPEAGVLLQTFTQPIFGQPTFFLELIERQTHPLATQPVQAQGFGEGNFRALFEAIEREQMKRGSLS